MACECTYSFGLGCCAASWRSEPTDFQFQRNCECVSKRVSKELRGVFGVDCWLCFTLCSPLTLLLTALIVLNAFTLTLIGIHSESQLCIYNWSLSTVFCFKISNHLCPLNPVATGVFQRPCDHYCQSQECCPTEPHSIIVSFLGAHWNMSCPHRA